MELEVHVVLFSNKGDYHHNVKEEKIVTYQCEHNVIYYLTCMMTEQGHGCR